MGGAAGFAGLAGARVWQVWGGGVRLGASCVTVLGGAGQGWGGAGRYRGGAAAGRGGQGGTGRGGSVWEGTPHLAGESSQWDGVGRCGAVRDDAARLAGEPRKHHAAIGAVKQRGGVRLALCQRAQGPSYSGQVLGAAGAYAADRGWGTWDAWNSVHLCPVRFPGW